ncbi:MAG: hypothetical protein WB799_12055 [Candidatus Sulfotelmatobacter sp.]
MHKSSTILMVCCFMAVQALCQDNANIKRQPSLSGTINVVVANDHGIVVLTDSMLTETVTHRQVPWPGRKLYRIDDQTVCAFAGFASAGTLALPDFLNSVSSIMGRYEDRLRNTNRPLSFSDKLELLNVVFTYYLTGIANIQGTAPDELQFLLTGYDPDGTPEIGRLVLRTALKPSAAGAFLRSVTQEHYVFPVTHRQVICVGGINNLALKILRDTNAWIGAPLVAPCEQSTSNQLLAVQEMKALAISLKQQTADQYNEVGGPNQIAILTDGRIQGSIEQPPGLPPVTVSSFKFEILTTLGAIYIDRPGEDPPRPFGFVTDRFTLFFRDQFIGVRQELDDAYFGHNEFKNCLLIYRGGKTTLDKSNQISNCDLEIAAGVSRDSPTVKQLLSDFTWRTVKYEVHLAPRL